MPIALVTGASTGLGREFALLAARRGYDVVITARNLPQLQSLADEVAKTTGRKTTVIPLDLAIPGAAKQLAEDLSERQIEPDLLVNNAGFGLLGEFWKLPADEQSRIVNLNVTALVDLTRLLLPAMIARRSGFVLNVASTAAFQPGPLMAVYYASKAFVLSFSHAIANETRPFGVRVTCLCPGPTKTEFARRANMQNTKLFSSGMAMSAKRVADIGFKALYKGRPLVVAGRVNRLGAFLTRFAPMRLTAAMARRVQG
jgi:uncharacterized protein